MSGPFKVGDVVCCVDDSRHPDWVRYYAWSGMTYHVPALGTVLQVTDVIIDGEDVGLGLTGFPTRILPDGRVDALSADRFRHLPKADPAFTEAMRALRPEKEGVA
jgi:hypothetical protein